MKIVPPFFTTVLLFTFLSGFAQGQHGEILSFRPTCPCETALLFKSRQYIDMPMRPLGISLNCNHSMPVAAATYEGSSLFDNWYLFTKWRKRKKAQSVYPKKSHIIRF
jgi:hypothetical protein